MSLVVVEVGWDGDHGVYDFLPEITLGDIPHLSKNHSGDFFRGEGSVFAVHLDGDHGFVILVGDTEWEMFNIGLDVLIGELAPNQPSSRIVSFLNLPYAAVGHSLDIKNRPRRVRGVLILGGVPYESLFIVEGDV